MEIKNLFQLLGIIYTVMGLAILANPKYYKSMISEYIRSSPVIFLNAVIVLAFGYFFLLVNSSWSTGLPLIITILGWLAVVKGLYILLLPQSYIKLVKSMKLHYLTFEASMAVILGIALLYLGFLK